MYGLPIFVPCVRLQQMLGSRSFGDFGFRTCRNVGPAVPWVKGIAASWMNPF